MIHRDNIIHAARPLRWLFWGTLLVLLAVTVARAADGTGIPVDLVNDAMGVLLITAAVGPLRALGADPSYAKRMGFVHCVAIFVLLESFLQHLLFARSWLLAFLSFAVGIATIVAMLSFAVCMRDVCRAAMLSEAARLWHRTFRLFLCLYGIPAGLLLLAGFAVTMSGQPLHFDLGPAGGLLLFVLFFVPLVSFFSAVSTMARAAEAMPFCTPDAAPLPLAAVRPGR